MKDSTQNFNIKSRAHELAHIRARESQTYTAMENTSATTTAQQVIAEQNAVENASATLVEGTTKKFTLKVVRVQLFEDADIVNVQLSFDKAIPGFVRTDDGDYVESEVDHLSLSRSALTRALCEKDEFIATMRDGQSTPLTRAQLSTILHGATVVLARTFHAAGFVPEGREPLTRSQWFTDIEGIKLSELANKLITQLVMQRMLG